MTKNWDGALKNNVFMITQGCNDVLIHRTWWMTHWSPSVFYYSAVFMDKCWFMRHIYPAWCWRLSSHLLTLETGTGEIGFKRQPYWSVCYKNFQEMINLPLNESCLDGPLPHPSLSGFQLSWWMENVPVWLFSTQWFVNVHLSDEPQLRMHYYKKNRLRSGSIVAEHHLVVEPKW